MSERSITSSVAISVIVTVDNAAPYLEALHAELLPVLESLGEPFELIFVDDGSTDDTGEVLLRLFKTDSHVRVIRFARQFGGAIAHTAGLRNARGSRVILLDVAMQASLQHIPEFLQKLDEGYDIVYANSRQVPIPLLRRVGREFALWFIRRMTGIVLPDAMNGLIAVSDRLVRRVNQYNEKKRSLDSLFAYLAYGRYTMVTVTPRKDVPPLPQPGLWTLTRSVLSMIVSHSTRPLLVAFWTGAGVMGIAVALFASWVLRVSTSGFEGAVLPLVVSIVVLLAGIQLLALGVLGEYIGRIYGEVLERPLYTISEIYDRSMDEGDDENTVVREPEAASS
jgi:polyisoprenyl-phosphate glycosyltransferase